ncbi:class I SAM-dependent methyltransferase [Flavobacterium sp.]|uniref:class I SAM-dependent methyltransferase n=1 Tax=Flavobacterium sp. TaxID=239 RepID=UPI003D6B1DD1
MKKKWTGERLETYVYTRDTIDHLHRYAIISKYVEGKVVLDIASGEGYGTNLISKKAKFVYGVDIDAQSVADAKHKYQKENIEFLVGSTDAIPLQDGSVDVLISYETIEHHDRHEEMMQEVKRVLKPGGIHIISTPDKYFYSDKRNFKNKFHVKELYKNEFVELLSKYFSKIQLLDQMFVNGNSIIYDAAEMAKSEVVSGDFSNITVEEKEATYLIIIASDESFIPHNLSVFNGIGVTSLEENKLAAHFKNSNSYKVGSFILAPFKFLKSLMK